MLGALRLHLDGVLWGLDVDGQKRPIQVDQNGRLGLSESDEAIFSLIAPADNGIAITPADNTDLPHVTRSLYIGSAGDVKVDFVTGGSSITLKNCTAGSVLPVRVKRVYSTGTTATNLVGLY